MAPIRALTEADGFVLLLGVDHTMNTTIHYAEQFAGRPSFVRWALTPNKVVECPKIPGCSLGFNAIEPYIKDSTREVEIGETTAQLVPMQDLVRTVQELIIMDRHALLCERKDCPHCDAIRKRTSKV